MVRKSLVNLRKDAGFRTQESLAAVIKVDRSTIAKWESGVGFPRTALLPKLADVLNCTVDDILRNTG